MHGLLFLSHIDRFQHANYESHHCRLTPEAVPVYHNLNMLTDVRGRYHGDSGSEVGCSVPPNISDNDPGLIRLLSING